jgi:hypothetical protein
LKLLINLKVDASIISNLMNDSTKDIAIVAIVIAIISIMLSTAMLLNSQTPQEPITGPQGPPGPQGQQGPQGETGQAGPSGSSIEIGGTIIHKTLPDENCDPKGNGWCPDGIKSKFLIQDKNIKTKSVVVINMLDANIGSQSATCSVSAIRVNNQEFIISCSAPVIDRSGLTYSIVTAP